MWGAEKGVLFSSSRVQSIVDSLTQLNPYANQEGLPAVGRPLESSIPRQKPVLEQIPYIQQLLNQLSYNFLPQTFFSLEKQRSLQSILFSAKDTLADALPIRCLEATFVAIYLTQDISDLERIPLSFKSRVSGQSHHHIVLALRYKGTFGAVGLSRQSSLMDKPMTSPSLSELVDDYKQCYERLGHELVSVRIGLYISHDWYSHRIPCWRFVTLNVRGIATLDGSEAGQLMKNLQALLPQLSEQYLRLTPQQLSVKTVTPPRTFPSPPPALRKPKTSPQRHMQQGVKCPAGAAVDDDGDVEENQRRIKAIANMSSPWSVEGVGPSKRLPATSPCARVSKASEKSQVAVDELKADEPPTAATRPPSQCVAGTRSQQPASIGRSSPVERAQSPSSPRPPEIVPQEGCGEMLTDDMVSTAFCCADTMMLLSSSDSDKAEGSCSDILDAILANAEARDRNPEGAAADFELERLLRECPL